MSLLCKLIGHRWEWTRKWTTYDGSIEWVNTERVLEPFCTRCGEPSPKYKARAQFAARERAQFIKRAMEKSR